MESEKKFTFFGLKLEQPLGEFYIGKIDGKQLLSMSRAEVRNMNTPNLDQRLGIQRELNNERVKEIKCYVNTSDASFPNSVILSAKRKDIEEISLIDARVGLYKITLSVNESTFQIIDGQHRIAGFAEYNKKDRFDVNVSLFLDMDTEQQAILFATINSKQKSVPQGLLVDLHTMQHSRNPIKSAHYICRLLNNDQACALYNRITPFYTSSNQEIYRYTQSTVINRIVKYISGTDLQLVNDRDDLKMKRRLIYADDQLRKKLIFRNLFIDENEGAIVLILKNYFGAVKRCWPDSWQCEGYVLARTIGFNALMWFLPKVIAITNKYDEIISEDEFYNVLKSLKISDLDFKAGGFQLSGYGESGIRNLLKEHLENDLSR